MGNWNNKNEIYLRIDRFVGDYHLVLDMRDAAEENHVVTNISIANKDCKKDKDTHWFKVDDKISVEVYNISDRRALDVFKELICVLEAHGEKGLFEFTDENEDIYTGKT